MAKGKKVPSLESKVNIIRGVVSKPKPRPKGKKK